jgi:hypothetical protein
VIPKDRRELTVVAVEFVGVGPAELRTVGGDPLGEAALACRRGVRVGQASFMAWYSSAVSNTSRSIRPRAVAGGGISQPGEDRSTARLPVAVLIAPTMSLKETDSGPTASTVTLSVRAPSLAQRLARSSTWIGRIR